MTSTSDWPFLTKINKIQFPSRFSEYFVFQAKARMFLRECSFFGKSAAEKVNDKIPVVIDALRLQTKCQW